MSLAEVFAPAIEYAEKGYPIDPMLAQSIDRGRNNLVEVPDDGEDLLAGRPAAQGRRSAEESRLRRHAAQAGRGRAAGQSEGGVARRRRSRRRSIGSTRATSRRSSIASSRRTAACMTGGRSRRLRAAVDRAAAHDLPRLRRLQQPVDVARRLRSADAGEPRRGLRPHGRSGRSPPKALHAVIEAIKVAKADIYRYVADPKFTSIPTAGMLSKEYAATRRALIDPPKAGAYPAPGTPEGRPTTSAPPAADRRFPRTLRRRAAHHELLDRRRVRQRHRRHADARRPLRQQRRRRQHRAAAEQRHAPRIDVARIRPTSTTSAPARFRSSTTRRWWC